MPPSSNRSVLLAAVTLLGAALGVTTAQADPAPASSNQHKTSNPFKVTDQQKGSTQVKTDQVKTNQVKTSNQIKLTSTQHKRDGTANSH